MKLTVELHQLQRFLNRLSPISTVCPNLVALIVVLLLPYNYDLTLVSR